MHYFTGSEIITNLRVMAYEIIRSSLGRLRKHEGGWNSAHRCICIGNETFVAWRKLKDEMKVSDDALACYLLSAAISAKRSHKQAEHKRLALQYCTLIISWN